MGEPKTDSVEVGATPEPPTERADHDLLGTRLCLRALDDGERCHEYLTRSGDNWRCGSGHVLDGSGQFSRVERGGHHRYGVRFMPTWPHVNLGVSAHISRKFGHLSLHLPFGVLVIGFVGDDR